VSGFFEQQEGHTLAARVLKQRAAGDAVQGSASGDSCADGACDAAQVAEVISHQPCLEETLLRPLAVEDGGA
jgi:hypothetical protein